MIPEWYEALLLGLASWRMFQLIGNDDILDRPRRWFLRLGNEWEKEGDPVPENYRVGWGAFITCPYCAGAWIAFAFYLAWRFVPDETLVVSMVLALSAAVVGFNRVLGESQE